MNGHMCMWTCVCIDASATMYVFCFFVVVFSDHTLMNNMRSHFGYVYIHVTARLCELMCIKACANVFNYALLHISVNMHPLISP